MSKYSDQLKLKVVEYCILENHGYLDAANHFGIKGEQTVSKWVRKYKEHGASGLIRNNQQYDGRFKEDVIKYMHSNHLSLMETCIKFNLGNHNVIGKWERIYYEEGPHALYEERRGRSKNMSSKPRKKTLSKEVEEDLIDEVQRLRMENAYLKKLQALVQERVKREKPKEHKPSQN